jgi:hypothetical protein
MPCYLHQTSDFSKFLLLKDFHALQESFPQCLTIELLRMCSCCLDADGSQFFGGHKVQRSLAG